MCLKQHCHVLEAAGLSARSSKHTVKYADPSKTHKILPWEYRQCSSQNFTIAGGIASVSDCSTVNSCHNPPQFFYPSQCKGKLTNPCTKVVDFCPCTHNPHDFKQVATILNNIAVKWAVDFLHGGENESRMVPPCYPALAKTLTGRLKGSEDHQIPGRLAIWVPL